MNYLIVFAGGGLGAAARYGMNVGVVRIAGSAFPWHTLAVNIIGCFLMGALTAATASRLNLSNETRLFLTTGVLGGFTTFSAFALDFALLIERRDQIWAVGYVLASVGLCIIACFAGLALVRAVAP